MFFCFCYSSMCGAIFFFLAFLPTSNIVTLQCTREPFSGTWSIDGNQIIASYTMMAMAIQAMMANLTSHPIPNFCTSFYFQFPIFSHLFHPKKYFPLHFLSASETRAMLVWSVGLKDGCVTHYCLHVLRRAIYLKQAILSYMELVFFQL